MTAVVIILGSLIFISLSIKPVPLGNILFLVSNILIIVFLIYAASLLFRRKVSPEPVTNNFVKKEPRFSVSDGYSASFQEPEDNSSSTETDKQWSLDLITSLEWKRFEELCAGYFNEKGFRAEVSIEGADGGIDIYLYKESFSETKAFGIVQCKAWNTYKVGVKPVRDLYVVMASEKAPLGVFINTGSYTSEAEEFAKGKSLKLLTGENLLGLIKTLPEDRQQNLLAKVTAGDYITPSCPSCGIKMIERVSQKGKNKGNKFWGCTNYPKCRSTIQVKKVG